jgi:hypothetical protein
MCNFLRELMAPFFIVWPLRKAQGDAEAFSMAIILQRGGALLLSMSGIHVPM